MNVINENDWKTLSGALRRLEPLTLTRTLGAFQVTAETARATPAWPVAMLVGVTVERNGRVVTRQWFDSVERAQKEVKGWKPTG